MINTIEVGLIGVVVALFIINVLIRNKHKRRELNTITNYIIIFFIGVIVHTLVIYFEVDQWYTDKRNLTAVRMLAS